MTTGRAFLTGAADGGNGSPSATDGLSASAAAAHLGVNERTVRRAVERGELPAVKVGGTFRIDLADLERYRRQRFGPDSAPPPPDDHAPSPRILSPAPSLPPLPRPLTSFVGREDLTAAIIALLRQPDMPLLSLIGPGGVGKTRLAQHVAAAVAPDFPDGACFVALAAVTNPRLVMATVVQALGLPAGDKRPPLERLIAFLRSRRFLLVLDNVEQVTSSGPEVTALLTSCHGLTVLVTSRIPLHVTGERQIPVPPLTLPVTSIPAFVAHAQQSEAVRLFVERAQAVTPTFTLSDETAPAVAEICRRLDGLPLAIELAAARSNLLSPSALLARLERRLPLLTGGPSDQPARLQTMHNAIAWSHDLLTLAEQDLFRHLAVFAGGCTLEAAAAVCGGQESGVKGQGEHAASSPTPDSRLLTPTLDGIASLVDKSLVQLSPGPGGEPRLSLLETVREFGFEQLDGSGETNAVRAAHAAFFLTLAEWGEQALTGADHKNWRDALFPEVGNFRAAQTWFAEQSDTESALRLVSSLTRLWWITGDIAGALRSLTEYLDRPEPVAPTVRAKALVLTGRFEAAAGNCPRGMSLAERGLALARTDHNALGEADAMAALGMICLFDGRQDEARRYLDDAIARYRTLDNRHQLGHALCQLAMVGDFGAFDRPANPDDLARSSAYCEEALGLFRAIGQSISIGKAVFIRGFLASRQRAYRQAAVDIGEAIAIFWDLHDLWELAAPLEDLADVAALTGRPASAARLYGAVEALRETIGKPIPLAFQAEYERELTVSRSALGDEAFEAGRAAGRALPLEDAVAEALALATETRSLNHSITPPEAEPRAAGPGLTPREQEVLHLLRDGASNRAIAETLFIGVSTVKNHVTNILNKLGVESRAAAVAYSHRHDLD